RYFFFNHYAPTELYTLSLHDALPIFSSVSAVAERNAEGFLKGRQYSVKIFVSLAAMLLVAGIGCREKPVDTGALITAQTVGLEQDRKSTRLNSSHDQISYAVFCLKKK